MCRLLTKILALNLFFTVFYIVKADNSPLLVRIEGKNVIEQYDLETNKKSILYQSQLDIISNLTVSIDQSHIAFIETKKGTVENREYKILPKNQLRIIDRAGKTTAILEEDVRKYTWDTNGEKLALITGKYFEGGFGFAPEKLFVYDIRQQILHNISIDYNPYEIYWSKTGDYFFVKTLQFQNGKNVLKINYDDGKITETSYKDLFFSPYEKYYVHFPDMNDYNFRLYETTTNKEITEIIPSGLGQPIGWLSKSKNYFLFRNTKSEKATQKIFGGISVITEQKIKSIQYTIFDVDAKKIVKKIENVKKSEWISHETILTFKNRGKTLIEEF